MLLGFTNMQIVVDSKELIMENKDTAGQHSHAPSARTSLANGGVNIVGMVHIIQVYMQLALSVVDHALSRC